MTDFTLYVFLTLVFCTNVICFTFTSKDGIEISYPIRFKRECRGDMDKIVTLNDIALSDCAIACGVRPFCKALSYKRMFNTCNLYSSDGNESERMKGPCVELQATDLLVGKKPCQDCDPEKACNPVTGKCEHTECIDNGLLMDGKVTGNIKTIGSHVQLTCSQGYRTKDSIECLPNGNWNVTVGACASEVTNVAVGKNTRMSSFEFGGNGDKGVDGITNQDYDDRSCFHTNEDNNPYWQVDLGQSYYIFRVVLYNRKDCCSIRARNLDLMVGTTEMNMVVVRHVYGQIKDIHTFNFDAGIVARYVKVVLRRKEFLHLCEVQVFGLKDLVLGR